MDSPLVSVIIAAHNEEAVIGACLDALDAQRDCPPLQVIVSANGCTDETAQMASAHGATVVDCVETGKAGALNAADLVATGFPRLYLDADIVLPEDAVAQVLRGFRSSSGILAVAPRRRMNTVGRPLPVRAYYAINDRLPAFSGSLFGRGLIALSEGGRSRFDRFPPMIADDLFVDSLFAEGEKSAAELEVIVEAPRRTRDLVARLVRVRRGNSQMRVTDLGGAQLKVRRSDRWAWLRDVVAPEPQLAFAAIPYVAITVTAELLARRARSDGWGKDYSTRSGGAGVGSGGEQEDPEPSRARVGETHMAAGHISGGGSQLQRGASEAMQVQGSAERATCGRPGRTGAK